MGDVVVGGLLALGGVLLAGVIQLIGNHKQDSRADSREQRATRRTVYAAFLASVHSLRGAAIDEATPGAPGTQESRDLALSEALNAYRGAYATAYLIAGTTMQGLLVSFDNEVISAGLATAQPQPGAPAPVWPSTPDLADKMREEMG